MEGLGIEITRRIRGDNRSAMPYSNSISVWKFNIQKSPVACLRIKPYYICEDLNTKGLDMNKAITSVWVVLGLVCSSVILPAVAERGEKAQRFLFNRTDTDGDGFISEEEFTTSQLERFKKMDTDKDGKVSFEENKQAIEKMRERRERFSR